MNFLYFHDYFTNYSCIGVVNVKNIMYNEYRI